VEIADLIVVYLSCGAPFGVLVFLSKHSRPKIRTTVEAILAAVLWPLIALSWTHRRLLLRNRAPARPLSQGQDVSGVANNSAFTEYETLTRALYDVNRGSGLISSELFAIAGHSNPALGAICSGRSRNALLVRRQRAASDALVEDLRRNNSNSADELRSIAGLCQQLGDDVTSELIVQIAHPHSTSPAASASAREPVRMAA
jgi:hypothetical protein